ncbi:MAG: hypothetical protein Q8N28_00305 [bacterium]|nr:hypothetical protein [bacterium]
MKLFSLILLVGLLTFFQVLGFSVFGVKPNLALAVVVAASFFIASFWEGFLLVVLAVLILKFSPGFAPEILVFALIGVGALIVKNYLPWRNFLNNLFLVVAGTFIFYLILSPNLILSAIFAKELFLNLVAGISIFALLSFSWQNKLI